MDRIVPPPHHPTIPALITHWPMYINHLHMDIENYVIGNSLHPLLPHMFSGNSPHAFLNMGLVVTHNLPRYGSLDLSQPFTTSPIHMGSGISLHPHSTMNGFWNLPHHLHIFLESPILKTHQLIYSGSSPTPLPH